MDLSSYQTTIREASAVSHYWILFACHVCGHSERKRGRCAACGAVWWPVEWRAECGKPVKECDDRCRDCGGHLTDCICEEAEESEREAAEA